MNEMDIYNEIDRAPEAFAASATWLEFCAAIGKRGDWLATILWAPRYYATAKAGKRTWKALYFPTAEKFSDLFTAAKLATMNGQPSGFMFMGGSGAVSGNFGGKRGWSKTCPDTRSISGSTWKCTYVQPIAAIDEEVSPNMIAPVRSFESIRREDGILITARDETGIGTRWLALLSKDADIRELFDAETVEFLEREAAADSEAWGEPVNV